MIKINLKLKEVRNKINYIGKYFKVVADEPTKELVRKYISKVNSKYESEEGYINWDLKKDILEENIFNFIFFGKKDWLEELEYLKKELQRFANKEEKINENIHHIKPNISIVVFLNQCI